LASTYETETSHNYYRFPMYSSGRRFWSVSGRSKPLARPKAGPSTERGGCHVEELFTMFGRPHTLRILHAILAHEGERARFSELVLQLDLAPKTLSARLKALVEVGILLRRSYGEVPPRVEYEATEKARAFGEVYRALGRWAQENDLNSRGIVSVTGRA
jgi:DNA-binding HxlR family transcriptional regulator